MNRELSRRRILIFTLSSGLWKMPEPNLTGHHTGQSEVLCFETNINDFFRNVFSCLWTSERGAYKMPFFFLFERLVPSMFSKISDFCDCKWQHACANSELCFRITETKKKVFWLASRTVASATGQDRRFPIPEVLPEHCCKHGEAGCGLF